MQLTDQGLFAVFAIFAMATFGCYAFAWQINREHNGRYEHLLIRMEIHERSIQVWDQVMQSRVLASFLDPNPVTPEEAAHIRWLHAMGLDSPAVGETDLLKAIEIFDYELDHGLVKESKKADAHLAVALLNKALERRRAARESQPMRAVGNGRKSWWQR